MITHHQKASVVAPLLAREDRIHRRLQVVIDSPARHAPEEGERARMRIEHHLLALARIGDQEKCAAMTQPHVRQLDHALDTAELHVLVAEVKLIRLAGRKVLRDKGTSHRMAAPLEQAHLSAHRVHRARVTFHAQRFVDPAPCVAHGSVISLQPPTTLPAWPGRDLTSAAVGSSAGTQGPRPPSAAPF